MKYYSLVRNNTIKIFFRTFWAAIFCWWVYGCFAACIFWDLMLKYFFWWCSSYVTPRFAKDSRSTLSHVEIKCPFNQLLFSLLDQLESFPEILMQRSIMLWDIPKRRSDSCDVLLWLERLDLMTNDSLFAPLQEGAQFLHGSFLFLCKRFHFS